MLARLLAHVKQVFASLINDLGKTEDLMLLPGECHINIVIPSAFLHIYNHLSICYLNRLFGPT
jgi:hypothetical protein